MNSVQGNTGLEWKIKDSVNDLAIIKYGNIYERSKVQKQIYCYTGSDFDSDFFKLLKRHPSRYQNLRTYETVIGCRFLILFKDGANTEPIMIFTNNTYYLQEHEWWLTPIGKKVFKFFQTLVITGNMELIWVSNLIERFFEHVIYDTKITNTKGMDDFIQSFNDRQIRLSTEGSSQES